MPVEDEDVPHLLEAATQGLARTVREERLAQPGRWSQEALAARMVLLGHPTWRQTTVAKVEAGRRPVSLSEAIALAYALGLPSIDRLVGGSDVGVSDHLVLNSVRRMRAEVDKRRDQFLAALEKESPEAAEHFRASMAAIDQASSDEMAELDSERDRWDAVLARLESVAPDDAGR